MVITEKFDFEQVKVRMGSRSWRVSISPHAGESLKESNSVRSQASLLYLSSGYGHCLKVIHTVGSQKHFKENNMRIQDWGDSCHLDIEAHRRPAVRWKERQRRDQHQDSKHRE